MSVRQDKLFTFQRTGKGVEAGVRSKAKESRIKIFYRIEDTEQLRITS